MTFYCAPCLSTPIFRTPAGHRRPPPCPSRATLSSKAPPPGASSRCERNPITSDSRPASIWVTGATPGEQARGPFASPTAVPRGPRKSAWLMISKSRARRTSFHIGKPSKLLALARRQPGEAIDESRPLTVSEALTLYERDLLARGSSPYNAEHPRMHLPAVILNKPVALLGGHELRKWRNSLLAK